MTWRAIFAWRSMQDGLNWTVGLTHDAVRPALQQLTRWARESGGPFLVLVVLVFCVLYYGYVKDTRTAVIY